MLSAPFNFFFIFESRGVPYQIEMNRNKDGSLEIKNQNIKKNLKFTLAFEGSSEV